MSAPQSGYIGLPLINLVRFKGLSILKQLHLEEQLLRTTSENWCIVNDGTDDPTIVMGISGSAAELIDTKSVLRDGVSVIRRFSGGGTVIVDSGTIFVTLICNKEAIAGLQPYPRPIMSWSGILYNRVFQGIGDFHLRENDYVFGTRKFGGNAQSITKDRWVHHTSFLWDYDVSNMAYLKHPKRVPEYRLAREHMEFICRMKDYMPRSLFIDKTVEALETDFTVRSIEPNGLQALLNTNFCPSTRLLTKKELDVAAFASQIESSPLSL
ncbi:hypothetical protein CsatB_011608 [Cannabis sativa]|uniref:uncharacterized protein LOC115705887 n=1 Tax=Cannabis sativa TaxID=3483 RepID=UPI0011E06821|nr:uncharacterized protein LOC115705887 [Cannabis sativa]XP_030489199.1 uncharacterized protein LOC115705887 [Cannabis sativa]XP_030489201.1 uncharacterized protein LOC115705887 [Cannabis sativa]